MSQMKHRDGFDLGSGRLSDQGKSLRAKSSNSGRMPDGLFNRFYPNEKAIWLHITPFQAWDQLVYDHDSASVIKVRRTWLQTTKHYHPGSKRTLICSAGPHRDQPCFADAVRREHYLKLDKIEERMGVRPKDEPPVGVANQYTFSIVVMENILSVPAWDKKTGEARKSKAGNAIYNYVPEPLAKLDPAQPLANLQKTFGGRFHMSIGKAALLQILQFDEEMKNYCKHCATSLVADSVICPDCEASYSVGDAMGGEDLIELRQKHLSCTCGYEGGMQPRLTCTGCGNADEGRLTDFDIRLKKEMLGEKQSILKIVGVRKPLSTLKSPEAKIEVQKMVESPLDLQAIFVPDGLEQQKRILGNLCMGLDPRPVKKGAGGSDVESYAEEPADSDERIQY